MFAADAARVTDETAGSEDREHTSGGVFEAVDSNLGAVVGVKEGAIDSIPGNEGRIAQAWVHVRGGLRVFSVYFWLSQGWFPRNEALLEAVLKRARITKHPWLVACDGNMKWIFRNLGFQKEQMHVVAPIEPSTCMSKGPKGELIERIYDYVIASGSLEGKISQMEVVDDRVHIKQCLLWLKEERRYRNGMSRSCRRCFRGTAEEGCQECQRER